MLETSNLPRKYTHIFRKYIKANIFRKSTKALIILLMSAIFAKNQRFLDKIAALLKVVLRELC